MVQLQARYEGSKKCTLSHPDGFTLPTATPLELGGDGSAFSPTDLVASGLLTCILTTLAMWAERRQLDLTGLRGEVVKEMSANGHRIARLPVVVEVPEAAVPTELRARLEQVGHRCPVHASLHPEIDAPIEYRYV